MWRDGIALVRAEGTRRSPTRRRPLVHARASASASRGRGGRSAHVIEATPAEGYASCSQAIQAMDLRDDLELITAPTLVIAGADDPRRRRRTAR